MKEKMMSKNRLEISDSTAISMPMKNLNCYSCCCINGCVGILWCIRKNHYARNDK